MSLTTRFSALFAAVAMSAALFAVPAHAADAPAADAAPAASAAAPAAAPAADAAPAAPAATAPVVTKEEVANPFGPAAVWNGDFVAKGTLIILTIMSLGSWYIIITKLIDQFKLMGQAGEVKAKFWKANSIQAGTASLKETSPFRFIAESGTKSTEHHDGALLEQIDLNTWVTMAISRAVERVQSRLREGLDFLATVGSTAPFVGLFGTVWGIYNALVQIGVAGQASIDKVAGPVGESLIMTAFGLFVAVPAVLGYNWLVKRNKSAMEEVRSFSADLHSVLLSGVMSSSQSVQAQTAKKG